MGFYVFVVAALASAISCSAQSTCQEKPNADYAFGQCGTRDFNRQGQRKSGEAYEKEFPWSCLLLDKDSPETKQKPKKVIGNCVVVPNNSENNRETTYKVLTTAIKVAAIENIPSKIIVRVGDYRRESFKHNHIDYDVEKIVLHPQFNVNDERLLNNIAIIFTKKHIDVKRQNVKSACFPSGCREQFGPASKCWVSGWNEESPDGLLSDIIMKADVSLISDAECNRRLKAQFNSQVEGLGELFNLDRSEICAASPKGEDSCNGGGGSPLVCMGKSKRWSVVGLVSWGIGCRKPGVPAIYTKIKTFQSWIDECNKNDNYNHCNQ